MIMFTMMLPFVLIPLVGLAIDETMLYTVKAKLQTAVDGASLAAAQSLSAGLDLSNQQAAATLAADQFIRANMTAGGHGAFWGAYNLNDQNCTVANGKAMTTGTGSQITYTNLGNCIWVTQDDTNKLRSVSLVASVQVPLLFMRVLGFSSGTVASSATASRRDVVMVLVIDRSGSIATEMAALQAGAEHFVNQFAAGRDKLGLVLMAGSSIVAYPPGDWGTKPPATIGAASTSTGPDTNFKSSGNPAIDTPNMLTSLQNMVVSGGNTGMAEALTLAHYELQAVNEPGALNIIVVWTDGEPNGITADFNAPTSNVIAAGSGCTNTAGNGTGVYPIVGSTSILGWMAQWGNYSAGSNAILGPFAPAQYTSGPPTGLFANQTTVTGWVESTYSSTNGNNINTQNGNHNNESTLSNTAGGAVGCVYDVSRSVPNPNHFGSTVINGIPSVDYYGNLTQGTAATLPGTGSGAYSRSDFTQSLIWTDAGDCHYTGGSRAAGGTGPNSGPLQLTGVLPGGTAPQNYPQTNACQFGLASWNAADMAGYKIHQDTTLTPIIYTMGYAPATGLDSAFLMRLSNCVPGQPCSPGGANATNTVYNSTIPSGMYIQINSIADVNPAFQALLSQILRLSM